MRGTLDVTSEQGTGSRFVLTLRRATVPTATLVDTIGGQG
jgi:hypothetical protein